jgi:poly(beta-D-mannuronate) lyase
MIKPILMTAGLLVSTIAVSGQNYVVDPQLTDYRSNQGESEVWVSHEDSDGGLGDVGSSGDTAFGPKGSARMRFKNSVNDNHFTAKPGLTQVVTGLPANTDMTYSLYYCDKKGSSSPSVLYYGVRDVVAGAPLTGKVIAESRVHTRDLDNAPKGKKKDCFRQVSVDFNSGISGNVEIFSLMEVKTEEDELPDMTKDIEVRIDEFSITAK